MRLSVEVLAESLGEKRGLPRCWWWSSVPPLKRLSVAPVLGTRAVLAGKVTTALFRQEDPPWSPCSPTGSGV